MQNFQRSEFEKNWPLDAWLLGRFFYELVFGWYDLLPIHTTFPESMLLKPNQMTWNLQASASVQIKMPISFNYFEQ